MFLNMASNKRKKRFRLRIIRLSIICVSLIVLAVILFRVIPFVKDKTLALPKFWNNTSTANTSESELKADVIKEKNKINEELSKTYPTLEQYMGVTEEKLKNIDYKLKYDNKFTDEGYVNSVFIKANDELMISKNLCKAYCVTEDEILTDPGIYYISAIDADNNKHTFHKYIIPPVQELIKDMDLGDDVESLDDLKKVINLNLDIYNQEIKFIVSEKFKEEINGLLQPVKDLVQEVLYERPELSCDTYSLHFSKDDMGYVVSDSVATITLNRNNQKAFSTGYEASMLFIVKSVDSWLAHFDDQELNDLTYIKNCLDYGMFNFKYSDESGDSSEYHSVETLLTTHKGLCDSISSYMSIMCNAAGIPSEMITGTMGDESHGWNSINYGGRDYMVDLTGCITVNSEPSLLRAGLTAEDFRQLGYGIDYDYQLIGKNYSDEKLLLDLISLADYDNVLYKVYNSEEEATLDSDVRAKLGTDDLIYYTINLSDGRVVFKWTAR